MKKKIVPPPMPFATPSDSPPQQSLLLGLSPVSAGFPSPAESYSEKTLDINEYLVRNPPATFFFRVKGDSMRDAGMLDGDFLVVDRSIAPQHGYIVVAIIDGEQLVKRLSVKNGKTALLAENPGYPPLVLKEGQELEVWGVVTGLFRRFASY